MPPRKLFPIACAIALTIAAAGAEDPVLAEDPEAIFIAGLEAYDGGALVDAAEAFRQAAEAGHLEALVALAGLTLEGQGVRRDPAAAARLYRRAAEAGDPLAQLNLGDLYARGLGVPRDLVEAHLWLSRAAAQGRRWPLARLRRIEAAMAPGELARARQQSTD